MTPEPVVYEVNTAVWLAELSRRSGRPVTLGTVPAAEWDAVVREGITMVWLMGVWGRSAAGREIALANDNLRAAWSAALPDWTDDDVVGSPYCIPDYTPAEAYGGWAGLDAARAELRARGAQLMVDWVPNHVAPDSPWLTSAPDAFIRGTATDLANNPAGFVEIGGSIFARGKDPYFAPWPDVIQVDAFAPSLRALAIHALDRVADHADAVRCDMAMLMLDDVVTATWGERVGPPRSPTYWTEVIEAVRRGHPDFRFVAEAYWDREWDLMQLGFDHCYDKRLYDRLESGDVGRDPRPSGRGHRLPAAAAALPGEPRRAPRRKHIRAPGPGEVPGRPGGNAARADPLARRPGRRSHGLHAGLPRPPDRRAGRPGLGRLVPLAVGRSGDRPPGHVEPT